MEKFNEMSFFNFYKEYEFERCNNSHGLTENEIAIEVIKGNINFVAGNHLCHKYFMKKNRISYDVCNKTEQNTFLKLL